MLKKLQNQPGQIVLLDLLKKLYKNSLKIRKKLIKICGKRGKICGKEEIAALAADFAEDFI